MIPSMPSMSTTTSPTHDVTLVPLISGAKPTKASCVAGEQVQSFNLLDHVCSGTTFTPGRVTRSKKKFLIGRVKGMESVSGGL
jgi:hypothetical protein